MPIYDTSIPAPLLYGHCCTRFLAVPSSRGIHIPRIPPEEVTYELAK